VRADVALVAKVVEELGEKLLEHMRKIRILAFEANLFGRQQ
jgi:hypothetical protein